MSELRLDYRDPEWVAKQLGIDKNAVYRYLDQGRLPGLRLGRKWLISESTLAEQFKQEERDQTHYRRMLVRQQAVDSLVDSMERTAGLPFTRRAHRSLWLAWEEGATKQHAYIGQEHFLLAFARDPECTAARVLTSFQFDARGAVEAVIGQGDSAEPPKGIDFLTERAKNALDLALQESAKRGDSTVGTEHILLGICREGEGLGFGLLKNHGIGVEEVEGALAKLRDGEEAQEGGE